MTIQWSDGFDFYNGVTAPAGFATKWTAFNAAPNGVTSTAAALRWGVGQALNLGNLNGVARNIGNETNKFGVFFAYRRDPSAFARVDTICGIGDKDGITGAGYHLMLGVTALGAPIVARRTSASITSMSYSILWQGADSLIMPGIHYGISFAGVISDTVGEFRLGLNGLEITHQTVLDTRNGGNGNAGQLILACFNSAVLGTTNYFDDSFVDNDFVFYPDCRVEPLWPTGDGGTLNFTPSTGANHYAVVDDATVNTADYLTGTAVGDKDILTLQNLSNNPATIYGVQVNTWGAKTDAVIRQIYNSIRFGGAESDGAAITLDTVGGKYERMMLQNPLLASDWVYGDVNATELVPKIAA